MCGAHDVNCEQGADGIVRCVTKCWVLNRLANQEAPDRESLLELRGALSVAALCARMQLWNPVGRHVDFWVVPCTPECLPPPTTTHNIAHRILN